MAEGKRAAELDPLSPQIPSTRASGSPSRGSTRRRRTWSKRAADLDPTLFFAPWEAGCIDIQEGKVRDAISEFRKAKAMESPAFVSAWLAYAYGASGDRAGAMAELEDLKKRSLRGSVRPFNLALVYLGLGDRARALDYLEKAYAADCQWLGWLRNDRIFDPLRSEPRFAALLKKLNSKSEPGVNRAFLAFRNNLVSERRQPGTAQALGRAAEQAGFEMIRRCHDLAVLKEASAKPARAPATKSRRI